MNAELNASLFALTLLIGMLACLEIGNRLGNRALAAGELKGAGAVEGAVFALLGLLIAFTFSGAATRFEVRRHLITEEANDIGTAWLRIDVIPIDAQPAIRELFIQYMDNRATIYRGIENPDVRKAKMETTAQLQQKIWDAAIAATSRPDAKNQAAMLFLPALNAMIDITTTREVATRNHPPVVIFLMLGALTLVSSLLAGYAMAGSGRGIRLHKLMFALIMAITFFVTIDLEYPRLGFIRIDDADRPIIELLESVQAR